MGKHVPSTYAPTENDFNKAIEAVKVLKAFCKNWYTMCDTTDLDMLEEALETDLDELLNE